jgi:hypothetical protein
MDAEAKYYNNFSRSPLVFPEIEGVNAGSDCFDVLNRPTGAFGNPIYHCKFIHLVAEMSIFSGTMGQNLRNCGGKISNVGRFLKKYSEEFSKFKIFLILYPSEN